MSQACSLTRRSARRTLTRILTTIALGALCSGCLVVRREQFSKPVGPGESVKFRRTAAGCETYSRALATEDFNLQVSVANWPTGWEVQFLLNLVPIHRYHYGSTEPLLVEVEVEPKTPGLTLDPAQIFFVGADQVRLPPAKTSYERSPERTSGTAIPVTSRAILRLEFPVEHRAYPEHDLPFQLSVEGLRVGSRAISISPITFEPKTITGPGFRLPY